MDTQALVQALSNTLFPDQREQAEALLEEVRSNIKFVEVLGNITLFSVFYLVHTLVVLLWSTIITMLYHIEYSSCLCDT